MGGKALRAATDVRSHHPKCGVALMVGAATPSVVDRAVAAGALGVVPKNARLPQLITTLMGVAGGCLTVDPSLLRPVDAGDGSLSQDLFFSFVTMTTVGYGNLVPAANPGQTFAVLEAVIGQLFLVVAVGKIISSLPRRGERSGS